MPEPDPEEEEGEEEPPSIPASGLEELPELEQEPCTGVTPIRIEA